MSHVGCVGRSGCTVGVCVPPSYRNDDNGNRNHSGVAACAPQQAQLAADAGIRILAVNVDAGANQSLMQQIADIGQDEHFHAGGSIDQYSQELSAIVRRLGGARPVELIR